MVTAKPQIAIKLVSKPYSKRTALGPLMVGIGVGWIFAALWLITGIFALVHNVYWGLTLLASTSGFSLFLGLMTYSMVRDANRTFVFELTDSDAVLYVYDRLQKRQSTQMVLLDDVKYVEYYPYRDSSSMILHTPYAQMEVPLWPMGEQVRDVIDFLDGRGLRIVNVQFDDVIPD
ncbi:MAG TPA: hypothetical protein EYN91_22715 [Candidatus Melainabacteria bacterium]|jgi:hypothetical protein|nr:hypothetical protein [Candidatus Melainabacteria bacterium]HIN64153.1 hypothetical protein [Candidatus Obscuribacterales bacterium]